MANALSGFAGLPTALESPSYASLMTQLQGKSGLLVETSRILSPVGFQTVANSGIEVVTTVNVPSEASDAGSIASVYVTASDEGASASGYASPNGGSAVATSVAAGPSQLATSSLAGVNPGTNGLGSTTSSSTAPAVAQGDGSKPHVSKAMVGLLAGIICAFGLTSV
jgi:hypothetical protein